MSKRLDFEKRQYLLCYATGSRLLHAKADYIAKDNEINEYELPMANEMMDTFVKAI